MRFLFDLISTRLAAARRSRVTLAATGLLSAGVVAVVLALGSGSFTSHAVQAPTISLDMVPTGNTYDDTTNTMTVGTIDSCLADAVANTATHTHLTQLVIQNVEDLVGWQVRMNYVGDQMRPLSFSAAPFTDTTTGDQVGFANLPIDTTTLTHRGVTTGSSIPPGAPGAQTALIGAAYGGTQSFAISPDTPAKSPAEVPAPNYSAPSGGVLANLNLQVVGNQSGQTLQMDLDDASPNPPGSDVVFFNGAGTTTIRLAESALFDGFHAEGLAACGAVVTPTPTETATPCALCATPTPTESPPPKPSPTMSPTPTATATPGPTGVHDAGVSRLRAPTSVRLQPGVPDTNGRVTVVVANNGDHADLIGIYLAFLPPGGSSNEGGCSPAGVQNLGALTLLPGAKLTVSTDPSWQCANPAAVDGAVWTLKAIADVHGDDFASCATLQQVFSGQCAAALADDDSVDTNNTLIRARPQVVAVK